MTKDHIKLLVQMLSWCPVFGHICWKLFPFLGLVFSSGSKLWTLLSQTATLLQYRFRARSGVVVESTAVGERVGQADLQLKPHSGFNTLSEKWASAMDGQALPTSGVVTVPVTTLDELIAKHGPPDYVKIDVEGFELPVIRGLTTPVRVLSFECNLPLFRAETDQVIERLLSLDAGTRFNARHGDRPSWMLSAPTDVAGLRRLLDASAAITCDVFAFMAGPA